MTFLHRMIVSAVVCGVMPGAVTLLAEDKQGASGTAQLANSSKVEAGVVRVNVLVTDSEGRVVSGLEKASFRVVDQGMPQEIVSLTASADPMTVVLLAEYSSHSSGYFANKSAIWGSRFLDQLQPSDWVALVTFDLKPTVRVDFTHRRFEVRDALSTLGPPMFSDANLFDAVIETLDKLDEVPGRKSIVLLATGANSFSAAVLDEVLERLKRTDTVIFCIGMAEAEATRFGSGGSYAQTGNWLKTFAERTGGLAFFPRFEGELPEIFNSVAGFLRNEYALGFRPAERLCDGRYHKLRIEVVGADGRPLRVKDEKRRQRKVEVYTREGYIAPGAAKQLESGEPFGVGQP